MEPRRHRLFGPSAATGPALPPRPADHAGFIRGTKTKTGLRVTARLDQRTYAKGIKVPDHEMQQLNIHKSKTCSQWNYTIKPQTPGSK